MKEFFYLAIGFAVGVVAAKFWSSKPGTDMVPGKPQASLGSRSMNQEQSRLKQEHLGKIMDYFASHQDMSNTEVERMLNVSDATAERYLNELERQGRIVQLGKTGRSVIYRKA